MPPTSLIRWGLAGPRAEGPEQLLSATLSVGLSDLQLLVHHFQPLQIAEDILWHPLREIDETVIFKDLNAISDYNW